MIKEFIENNGKFAAEGIKAMNKVRLVELRNFIYYKISTIIKTLLANITPRAFLPHPEISQDEGQLCLVLNSEL